MEYLLFRVLRAVVRPLSARSLVRLARGGGALVNKLTPRRRRIARINLDIAFGDTKSNAEKDRILQESWAQMVLSGLQCLWVSHRTRERVIELIPEEPEGVDELREVLKRGKGVFFLTAHYGNWEVMGIYHGYRQYCTLNSIARKLDNPYLEKFVMDLRTISGNKILHREESPLKIVRAVRGGNGVAVMMDQNGGDGALFVDFFGRKAATPRSLALLSRATGTPIMPMFCHPTENGRYRIVYGPELRLETTGDKDADVMRWTEACEKFLEDAIRARPEPWMWIHRRWKSRPPEERHRPIY